MCIVAGSAGPSVLERPVSVTLDGGPIELAAAVGAVSGKAAAWSGRARSRGSRESASLPRGFFRERAEPSDSRKMCSVRATTNALIWLRAWPLARLPCIVARSALSG